MRLLHAADLHLGKRLHMADLSADQDAMLRQLLDAASGADAVLLAGDVYNRQQPAPECITRFSRFLSDLAALGKPVFLCRGNHDGEAHIAYGADIMRLGGVRVTDVFSGRAQRFRLEDGFGPLNVYLLPYIKPAQARRFFPEARIETCADAVRAALAGAPANPAERNVLVTHLFVSGGFESDSEEATVGGAERIDPELFSAFDYVALGHLHRAQTLSGGRIRYSGAPLCYSFEERGQQKSFSLIELGRKGELPAVREIPVRPARALVRHTGALRDLCALPPSDDYVQAFLTDEAMPLDAASALRATFPNLLNLRMVGLEARAEGLSLDVERAAAADPLTHFAEFFAFQNGGRRPNERQMAIAREILAERGAEV